MAAVHVPRVAVNAELPEMPTTETVSGAVPVFVTVASLVVVEPAALAPNAMPAMLAVGAAATPVPVRPTTIGDGALAAVWAIETDAVFPPVEVGRNVTLRLHEPPAGMASVQPVTVDIDASVAGLATVGRGRGAGPVLLIGIVFAADVVLTLWLAKASDAGVTAIAGAGAVPVPLSVTSAGEPGAFDARFSVADRAPGA